MCVWCLFTVYVLCVFSRPSWAWVLSFLASGGPGPMSLEHGQSADFPRRIEALSARWSKMCLANRLVLLEETSRPICTYYIELLFEDVCWLSRPCTCIHPRLCCFVWSWVWTERGSVGSVPKGGRIRSSYFELHTPHGLMCVFSSFGGPMFVCFLIWIAVASCGSICGAFFHGVCFNHIDPWSM